MEVKGPTSTPYAARVQSKETVPEVEITIELLSHPIKLKVDLKTTVGNLKEKIRAEISMDADEKITLLYESQTMEDDRTLASYDYDITKEIYQAAKNTEKRVNKTGLAFGIKFNKLDEILLQDFDKTAPDYCYVSSGLNLRGVCDDPNKKCPAFGKVVWIQKGMGTFSIPVQAYTSDCPLCKKTAKNVENLGFFNCLYSIDGMQISPTRKDVKQNDLVADNKQFTTFKKTRELAHWVKLDITTQPRKK